MDEADDQDDSIYNYLRYILPDGRRARMFRMLQNPPLSTEVEEKRYITEAGEATEEIRAIMKDIFEKFDKDNDNKWSFEEWNEYLVKSGAKPVDRADWENFLEANKQEDEEEDDVDDEDDDNSKKKSKADSKDKGMDLAFWIRISIDSILLDPEKERKQFADLGWDIPAERLL